MAIDDNTFDGSFDTTVRDSYNPTENNTINVGIDVDNALNTDNSVTGSGNTDVTTDGAYNEDSHDTETNTETDVRDSYNDNSDNSTDDHSDNSTNGSYNDNSDNSTDDSYNTWTDNSQDDNSVNAGARSYNAGFGDVSLGGGAGGAGGMAAAAVEGGGNNLTLDGRTTIVDQSINANVMGYGNVGLDAANEVVVASGDDAIAAGDDVDIHTDIDNSTMFAAYGDVNVNNTTSVTTVVDSYNEETDNSSYTDNSTYTGIDDSYNDDSDTYTATNSFNEELISISENTWDIDADVIWDSQDSVITPDAAPDLDVDI